MNKIFGAVIQGLIKGVKGKPSYKKATSYTGRKRKARYY